MTSRPPAEMVSTPIPLLDLVAQYQAIKPEIDEAVQRVLNSGQFILGPEVEAFEQEMAAYCGTPYAVGVASGTDALELALRACGIGPGDEVLTSSFSFIAAAEATLAVGAAPVFVDIDVRTFTMDPAQLVGAITSKTRAIIPVHLFGHPCDMGPIRDVARRHRLMVIEDCAQAMGARYQGQRVGSFGDAAILSFYPSKNLGAYGDGGMVVTNDASVAERIRLLRAHGSRQRYAHETLGRNSRLDELQAAILRVKLRHLDAWTVARRRHAKAYADAFSAAGVTSVGLPQERTGCEHVYHLYTIRLKERDRLQQVLEAGGIATQVAYPSTLPEQPAIASHCRTVGECPEARRAAQEVLSLPMYPELTSEMVSHVINRLGTILGKREVART